MNWSQVSRFFLVFTFTSCGLFFWGASPARCQTNFVQGYYITATRDTVSGYIEFGSDAKNSRQCSFKPTIKSKVITLHPDDIEGYVLKNTTYFEKHSFQHEGKTLVRFFKVLMRGQLPLLEMNARYFVKDRQGKLHDITLKRVTNQIPHAVSVLRDLMNDCLDVYYNLNDDFRSNEDLPRIFRRYNRCVETTAVTAFEPSTLRIKSICTAGVSFSALAASATYAGIWQAADFHTQASVSVGTYVSVFIPRVHENFRIMAELLYHRSNRYAFFKYDQTNNDVLLNHTYIRLPVYAQIPVGKFVFLAGPQGLIVDNRKDRWRQETFTQNVVITREMAVQRVNGLSPGFMLGVGTLWNANTIHIIPSARFSINPNASHPFKPTWQFLEFNLKVGFNKRQ